MSLFETQTIVALIAGMVVGVIGFLPLMGVVVLSYRKDVQPSIAKGIVAIALSSAFLLMFEVAVWKLVPNECLAVFAGMLVGFFVMWGVLAVVAMKRKL